MAVLAPPARAFSALSWRSGGKALLLLGLLVGAAFILRHFRLGVLQTLPADGAGAAVLIGVGGLLTAIGFPRQLVAFAGGYVFGAWAGGGLALLAQLAGCLLDFGCARFIARGAVARRFGGRLRRMDAFLSAHPFSSTLTLRLLPVGNNLVLNLLAGLSAIKAAPFLAGSLIGYLPQTVIFTLAGSGVHVAHGVQLAVGAALFVLSALSGAWLLRRVAARNKPVLV